MSSRGSTTSIERPDDSFAGLSKTDSMQPWDLVQSELGGLWTYADFLDDEREVKVFIGMTPLQGTSEEPCAPEVILSRALCHVFVERMPERALPELVESMVRTFDFYREAAGTLALPASQPQQTRAKVGRQYQRPPFDMPKE